MVIAVICVLCSRLLNANICTLQDSFVENLLRIIRAMKPKRKKGKRYV